MKWMLAVALFALTSGALAQGAERLDSNLPRAPASTPQVGTEIDSSAIRATEDRAPEASPVGGPAAASGKSVGGAFLAGTVVHVRLGATVSSGQARNGDLVRATLATAVRTVTGASLPAGTRVTGTVVSSARAGVVQSGGVLSLQLTHVGPLAVVTDVAEFDGAEGHKDLPDSAPAKGTEATARAGTVLLFHVLENGAVPGIVPGILPGAHADTGKGAGTPPQQAPPTQQPQTQGDRDRQPINGGGKAPTTAAPTLPR